MERDRYHKNANDKDKNFNSHAHVERDRLVPTDLHLPTISTHTLTWSVTCQAHLTLRPQTYFNSHAHVERDATLTPSSFSLADFNSHAHVERDMRSNWVSNSTMISTHTLTWSVTNPVIAFRTITLISTHTLTWSVTGLDREHGQNARYFNSHAHVERDKLTKFFAYANVISTHTLTWSVTTDKTHYGANISISTHTLTWSVTGCGQAKGTNEKNFNSHAHVERDKSQECVDAEAGHFNSHAHVERDTDNS